MKKIKKISVMLLAFGGLFFFPFECENNPFENQAQITVEQQTGVDAIQVVDITKL